MTRVDVKAQPVFYAHDLADALDLPTSTVEWEKATVVIRVPVHATATTDVAEVEVPLGVFAALLAKHCGVVVKPVGGPDA